MKHLLQLLLITWSQSFTLFILCQKFDEKRFIIVSDSPSGLLLYREIRDREHLDITEREVDLDTKQRICEDILSNYLFRRHGEYPYDRNFCCFTDLFDGHQNCPTRTIRVMPYDRMEDKFDEIVFVCLACRCASHKVAYYISKEYNLNTETDGSDNFIAGRFIFKKYLLKEVSQLHGLAELPGTTHTSPEYDIESLYIQRRKKYSVAYFQKEDALCKLAEEEKRRICTAVFNSKYFEETISFSHVRKVETSCELRTISFQTEYGKEAASERRFRERMLRCKSRGNAKENNYLLSHAYASDQIFSYFRRSETEDVFPENFTTNIRLTFSSRHRPWIPRFSDDDVYEDYH